MGKLKVYLDTSIISYLDQTDAPEKMKETLRLWNLFRQKKYEVYISDIVVREMNRCTPEKLMIFRNYLQQIDYEILVTSENVVNLAEKIVNFGVLKMKSFDDCQHIAAAVLAGCDVITSWNFKHIVNIKTIRGIRVIPTAEGYKDLMICSPTALISGEEEYYE